MWPFPGHSPWTGCKSVISTLEWRVSLVLSATASFFPPDVPSFQVRVDPVVSHWCDGLAPASDSSLREQCFQQKSPLAPSRILNL